ncbi:MAG: hypothetical protein GX422_12340, partial [Deltaproteobacteria bacterium]|nr:hypothetical protein [Deltaproteobacteria bacterium]
VLLGVLNKHSLITWQRFLARLWRTSVFDHARFFSVYELHSLVAEAISPSVKIRWGTCLTLPLSVARYLHFLESSPYFQWHPFGHFIAMRLDVEFTFHCLQEPLFAEPRHSLSLFTPNASCVRDKSAEGAAPTAGHLDPDPPSVIAENCQKTL